MKRKILPYLLIWLLALFIWWSFVYVDAYGKDGINPDLNWSSDWGSDWWWGWSVNWPKGNGVNPDWWWNWWWGWWWGWSVNWPKGNGVNPDWGSDWWWTSTTTPSSSDTPSENDCSKWCCGIKLNTNFPIIWNCIEINGAETNPTNAFPYMVWVLTKIVISVILVVCFIFVIWAGILRSADKPDPAKKMLKRVAITILLLWFSGVILKLVNPNFFS